jgi:hypothetical protein
MERELWGNVARDVPARYLKTSRKDERGGIKCKSKNCGKIKRD